MGEVRAKVKFINIFDEYLKKEKIRQFELDCLIESGAVITLLPKEVADLLELPGSGSVIVTFADERKEQLKKVGPVKIQIGDRSGNFDCVVGPPNCEPLIGQIVLEELDLIIDTKDQKLIVRPGSPFLPLVKMK